MATTVADYSSVKCASPIDLKLERPLFVECVEVDLGGPGVYLPELLLRVGDTWRYPLPLLYLSYLYSSIVLVRTEYGEEENTYSRTPYVQVHIGKVHPGGRFI